MYASHFDFSQLINNGESMWRHIDIEPSWFRVIEYGYIHGVNVSFSLSLAIPEFIQEQVGELDPQQRVPDGRTLADHARNKGNIEAANILDPLVRAT